MASVATEFTVHNQSRQAGARRKQMRAFSILSILPALLLVYAVLIPVEVAVYLGPVRVGFYRAVLILMFPVIIYHIIQRGFRPHWIDGLMLLASLWLPVSFWVNYDFATGLEAGFSQAIDIFIAYMIGRIYINSPSDFKQFLAYLLPGLVVIAFLMMAESISGKLFVRGTASAIFGGGAEAGPVPPPAVHPAARPVLGKGGF